MFWLRSSPRSDKKPLAIFDRQHFVAAISDRRWKSGHAIACPSKSAA
jgi:hypothetical protein